MIILTSIFFCFLFTSIPLFLLQFMTAPYYNYEPEPNRAKKQGLPAKSLSTGRYDGNSFFIQQSLKYFY